MSFKLDTFQIKAIDAIDSGINVLITAPTGSGKTLPAEHAIVKFCKQGKKVIYTTPIKALSNQKYRDFTEKFPELSFGLITGDNRNNPEADCLIMTTEILNNTLFHMKNTNIAKDTLHFQIDLQNDLAAVVFDEVHYINDWERGHIWEKCMARLPEHVVQIMLSATLSHPEIIPDWFKTVLNREVVLCEHSQRSVPLEHAIFISYPDSAINKIKPPKLKKFCENVNNQVLQLKLGNKSFNTDNYNKFYKIYNAISGRISDKFVIKKMHHYLKTNDLLPAITFVLSRSQIEKFARQTELVLFSEDDTRRSTIANECKRLLKRIPNWEEYTKLPEYNFYLKILEKGYGIHHSGMIPVFRELMEILFETGYIKMLYATETFAIGMNMPTRAVVFTSLQKFDGTQFRNEPGRSFFKYT